MEVWQEDLECTICLDFSVSPIQHCTNGHIVCGICFERVKKCGQCQGEFSLSFLAERLARRHKVEIPCRNSNQGCSQIIKSTEMIQHLDNQCGYRPIKCLNENCYKIMNLEDLENHLDAVHNIPSCSDSQVPTVVRTLMYNNPLNTALLFLKKSFDGKVFILHTKLQNGVIFEWLSVIGDNSVAEKYRFLMKSPEKLPTTLSNTASYSWNLPVVPIHESQFNKVRRLGNVGAILAEALNPFCKESQDPVNEARFAVTHEIIQV